MDISAKRHSVGLEWGKVLTTVCAADRLLTVAVIVLLGVVPVCLLLPSREHLYLIAGMIIGALPSLLIGLPGKLIVPPDAAQVLSSRAADFLTKRRYVLANSSLAGSQWRHDVPRLTRWSGDEVTIMRTPEAVVVNGPIGLLWRLARKLSSPRQSMAAR